jgi:HD-like signal output (HDOD) protein
MQDHTTIGVLEDRISTLPLFDKNVLEIISLLDDAESDFEMIVGKLSPEVTAKFLSMANSAYYGVEVKSITHALRVLGFNAMRQSLVTSLLIDHFDKFAGSSRFQFEKYHSQAHFCAAVSRILGEALQYEKVGDLITASLLHNIGKLIIAAYFGEELQQILKLKEGGAVPTHEAERRVLGCTHAEISALVLKKFNIPDDLCQAVRYHDSKEKLPSAVMDQPLLLILRESTRIVDALELSGTLDSSKLIEEMQASIAEGREICQEMQRQEIKTRGYEEFFSELLQCVAGVVERDLKWIFKERQAADNSAIQKPEKNDEKPKATGGGS